MRTPTFVALACACALALPAAALADPIPAGSYTAQVTGGSIQLGSMTIPVPQSPAIPVDIGSTPLSKSVSNVQLGPITVVSGSASFDPTTGNGGVSGAFYVSAGMCTLGSAASPISFAFDTTQGSPYNASTGSLTIAGPIPALTPVCGGVPLTTIFNQGGSASVDVKLTPAPAGSADTPAPTSTPSIQAQAPVVTHPAVKHKLRRHHRRHHSHH